MKAMETASSCFARRSVFARMGQHLVAVQPLVLSQVFWSHAVRYRYSSQRPFQIEVRISFLSVYGSRGVIEYYFEV
jgi:hypothetical protein